jgi:cytochrome c553
LPLPVFQRHCRQLIWNAASKSHVSVAYAMAKRASHKTPKCPIWQGSRHSTWKKSLKDFQSGAHEDRRMTLMAQPLSDEDIKDVAAWYASFVVTVSRPEE